MEPIGVTAELDSADTLLSVFTSAAVAVSTDCKGLGTCGKCLVRLGAGELTPPTDVELRKVQNEGLAEGWRLACQAKPLTPRVSIEVREIRGRRRILSTSGLRHGEARPAVSKEVVGFVKATLEDARGGQQRVCDQLGVAAVPLSVLSRLPDSLRRNRWSLLVTRYRVGDEPATLIDVEPPSEQPRAFGVAVDIGTSKIIAYLLDLLDGRLIDQEAVEYPQMRFGEDVITRTSQAFRDGQGA